MDDGDVMRVFKKNPFHAILSALAPLLFTGMLIVGLMIGLGQAEDSSRSEGVRLLQDALYRVALHSYAVNGHFPESLDYIIQNYNIHIDRSRFDVVYGVFASNVLPDIRVWAVGFD